MQIGINVKNDSRFKKLDTKIKNRVKKKKGKTSQNCKSPMQKQRFITTIKNVTEGKKKLKSLIRFHSANKIDNYNRWWGGRKEKEKKNLKESTEQIKT